MNISILALSLLSLSSSAHAAPERRLNSSKSSKSIKSAKGASSSDDATVAPVDPVPEPTPPPPPPPPPPVFRSAAPLYNQYDVCTDFCKGAITTCEGVVDWVTDTYATPFTRHLSGGAGTEATGKPREQFGACHDTCMDWVYWRNEAAPDFSTRFINGYTIGDSLNCRYFHLIVASGVGSYGIAASESESAAQHCQHITNDGGWVCTDQRNDDGKTPAQLYKEASFTKHRLGDCWLTGDGDKIADCHRKGLSDATVDQQLSWLPDDVCYIFLHQNALTKVPDLSRFTELKGIYLENNAISMLESDTFAANTNIEIINLSNNFITELPVDLLTANTALKAVFINFNYISNVPVTFLSTLSALELVTFVDNRLTGFELGTFDGLGNVKLLAFGQQGKAGDKGQIFTGLPDGLFDDLVSLEYLSTFINSVGTLKDSFFGDWSSKVESIAIFQDGGQPLVVEDGVFDKLPNIIDFTSYTSGNVINPADVANNAALRQVLYGSQNDILAPLPEPALYNAALL